MVKPLILQIVGYQNSGKTTFTMKLIKALSQFELKTATIKHHGHGGKPEAVEQKDSAKHLLAGAAASIVEGDGRIILQSEKCSLCLEEQIRLLEFFLPDVILIEGHKHENFPKLLLIKNIEDASLIESLINVKGILCWGEDLKTILEKDTDIPIHSLLDDEAVQLIANGLRNKIYHR